MESDRYNVSDSELTKRVGISKFAVPSESERVSETPKASPTNNTSEREITSEVPPVKVNDRVSEMEIVSERPKGELVNRVSEIERVSEIPNTRFKAADRVSEMEIVSERGVFWVREVRTESDRLKLSLKANPNPDVENRILSDNISASYNISCVGTASRTASDRLRASVKRAWSELLITLPSDNVNVSSTD
jgi:hypothetical protein